MRRGAGVTDTPFVANLLLFGRFLRRAGLEVTSVASRQENVDLVIDFAIRGSKRLHDQLMITLLHHDHVRTVSTGE